MIRKELALVIVVVVLPCVGFLCLMNAQLSLAPDRGQVSSEVQRVQGELQHRNDILTKEVQRQGAQLGELRAELERLRNLITGPTSDTADGEEGMTGAQTSDKAARLSRGALPEDDSIAAEINRLLEKYHCPASHPHPFKADDLLIPNRCCATAVNCHGEPLDAMQDFECCDGGAEASMPITYNFSGPDSPCDQYPWWDLSAKPYWAAMKRTAEESARPKGQSWPSGAWAGGGDVVLNAADVTKARSYVGSAWGLSGRRQFDTATKFMGLDQQHEFLEIGCGALNAGQFFLSYLDKDRYVCVEPNSVLHNLSVSASATLQGNVSAKHPVLVPRDDFDPRPGIQAGRLFDRSWSHSVLSHAADWQLMQYFEVMAAVLRPGTGTGMASIRFSDGTGTEEAATHDVAWVYPGVSYFSFAEARCMAKKVGLELRLLPEARLFMTEVVPAELHDWVWMRRL